MKILQVIHGYPMRFNAGAEVYTQTLCQELAERHEVHVFTRFEDGTALDLALRHETDPFDPRIALYLVNNVLGRQRYLNQGVGGRFVEVLEQVGPDVVHIGHLAHLSTSLVSEAAARRIPVVYTLHDFWLMCPRGQFLQMFSDDPLSPAPLCDRQEHRTCAERCYAPRFSDPGREEEVAHWSRWVSRRMEGARELAGLVDVFIAPAAHLRDRFCNEWGLPPEKVVQLDCGLDVGRLGGRRRGAGEPFTFGYIGTHIPAKGVHHLIEAFGLLRGDARLRIWGRPQADSEGFRALAQQLPSGVPERIEWCGEYRNADIVRDVFNHVDAIVVPSIWAETSPLVIREAQQARVPVITANVGGMAELVHHEVNGLLFKHRDPVALARQMQRCADDPELARRLGARGYLRSQTGDVPAIREHARDVEAIYARVLRPCEG